MIDLLAFDWGWLAGATLLGLAAGWIAVVQRGPAISRIAAAWLSVVALVVLGAAFAHLVPGRAGYWLDLWLVMLACYLFGCLIGSWLRDRVIARSTHPV
jgi:hypothetical protein